MVNYSAYHWAEKARKAAEEAGKISDLSDYLNKTSTEEQVINSPIVVANSLTLTDNKGGAITTSIVNGIPTIASNNGIEVISKVDFEKEIIAPNQLDYSRITNCLTHIPQDIKLELVEGVLTLKAGSKVYVPNGFDIVEGTGVTYYAWVAEELAGDVIYSASPTPNIGDQLYSYNGVEMIEIIKVTSFNGNTINLVYNRNLESDITLTTENKIPKFDTITTQKDLSLSSANISAGKKALIYCRPQDDIFGVMDTYTSGSTAPTTKYTLWYDTNANLVKKIEGTVGVSSYTCCFPLGVITVGDNKTIASIDQIFNGLGYIGSTVFALPGVKGLIPDGRNADGSLKNIEFEFDKVVTLTDGGSFNHYLAVYDNLNLVNPITITYDENRNYNTNNGNIENLCIVGTFSRNNGVISNFRPYSTFQAVDRNDTSWLSGLGMPSEKYDVLTLGASDTTYTAPANGYYNVVLQVETEQHAFVEMINLTCESFSKNVEKERGTARIEIGCRKGDVIKIQFSKIAQNDINRLRFYYAEGEK